MTMNERVYINENFTATIICPECDQTRNANVSKYIGLKSAVTVKCKCKCGHLFKVELERRKFCRTNISLPGMCTDNEKNSTKVKVVDISRAGVKIEMKSDCIYTIGQNLKLRFILDDESRSEIIRDVSVRSIHGKFMGVEFLSNEHSDNLGLYLMFK